MVINEIFPDVNDFIQVKLVMVAEVDKAAKAVETVSLIRELVKVEAPKENVDLENEDFVETVPTVDKRDIISVEVLVGSLIGLEHLNKDLAIVMGMEMVLPIVNVLVFVGTKESRIHISFTI